MPALTFSQLQIVSGRRANECAQAIHARPPEWWSNAMAGETGEVCNKTKKLSRLLTGDVAWNKHNDRDVEKLREEIGCEVADVVIYADLLMQRMGLSLEEYIVKVFNQKSDEVGSTHKLSA